MEEMTAIQEIAQVETKCCPYCSESILASAQKCKHCGEYLEEYLHKARANGVSQQTEKKWSPGIAVFFSLIFPGLGQMYKGQGWSGFLWLIFVLVGYLFFVIPGVILHLMCLVDAAKGDPDSVKEDPYERTARKEISQT